MLIIEIERPGRVAEPSELRSEFAHLAIGAIGRVCADANTFAHDQPAVLLLGDLLREMSSSDRSEQIGQEQLIEPWCFVTQIKTGGIAKRIEAFGKKEVRRVVAVVIAHSTGGFANTHVLE